MNKMILANLTYRPVRSLITVLAVAIEVTLILLIVGLALGILNDSRDRQKGVGADLWVRPPAQTMFTAFSTASMPAKVGDIIRKQPHVVAVSPVVYQVTSGSSLEMLNGIDLKSFQEVGGPLRFLEGGPFEHPDDMIVDNIYASANKLHPGVTVNVLNHNFRVSGVIPSGRGSRRYVAIRTLQELIDVESKVSAFNIRLDDPSHAEAMAEQLREILPSYSIVTLREWLSVMTTNHVPGLASFIKVVIGIALVIGFIVIFQAMYTSVLERTREIGILKSLGASRIYIMQVILAEALLLALVGILAGAIISTVGRFGIVRSFPTLSILPISWNWALNATMVAISSAMLGAIYPAYKAARKDPIDALAYE
jgi:putative ABC transport system permease protein